MAENADLERVRDPVLLREGRCPGDGGAVPAEQRDAAGKHAHRQGPSDQGGDGDAQSVLQHHENRHRPEEKDERPPAGLEVAHARVDPDGREEVDEEHVARRQLEGDPVAGDEVDEPERHREQQPAGDRLRNVVLAQQRNPPGECLADEEHHDAGGDREERAYEQHALRLEFDHPPPRRMLGFEPPRSMPLGGGRRYRPVSRSARTQAA